MNMKKINFLAIALIAILFASCGKGYQVTAQLENTNLEGKSAYLYVLDPTKMSEPVLVDSAVVKENKVSFEADKYEGTSLPAQAVLAFDKKLDHMTMEMPEQAPVLLFLEKGSVNVELGLNNKQRLSGTPTNDRYNQLLELIDQSEADPTLADKVSEEGGKAFFDIISSNINNNIGHSLILSGMPLTMLDGKQAKSLMAMLPEDFKTKYEGSGDIINFLESKAKAELDAIIDAELQAADGSKSQLSALVGAKKYTLIDFWASWCGPCIREVPHLKEAYEAYKGQGFEIIGISVDEDAAAWQEAIEANGMNWLHFNDGSKEGIATQYGVTSIPHTLLVDDQGKVIAMNLRGDALSAKLAELMK